MKLTVIGTGYVGLVTGTCFAEVGNHVTCVDIDQAKIEGLKKGILPIYEPGLEEMVLRNVAEKRLHFTTSLKEAAKGCPVFFIAVGTPPDEDGSADLSHVLTVARQIGQLIEEDAVIVDKSTVPVGTAERVKAAVQKELQKRGKSIQVDVVSNPEFLKEGAAVNDFLKPDRIIIGSDSQRAQEVMEELYGPFNRSHQRTIFMGIRDAEMTKYTANAMLATKISFMNEIANLCEKFEVDVENVRLGIGSDQRIGYHFIYPGSGFGGSCFPKDVRALVKMAEEQGYEPMILNAVQTRNMMQKERLGEKINAFFNNNLKGKLFGLWGLAFKPGTDDMREASSIHLLTTLIEGGAKVRAYDPVAMDVARKTLPKAWFESGQLTLVEHQYAALEGADALALVTEWKPFRHPDFDAMKRMMNQAIIFDGRNQYDPYQLAKAGFYYEGIGRGPYLTAGQPILGAAE